MANYTSFGAPDILTTLYPHGVEEEFMAEFPSYGLFAKKLDYLTERGRELNWQISGSGGAATSVAESEANENASIHARPMITRVREYATATVEREDILATRNDKDRIIEVWQLAISNCIRGIKRSWGTHIFRDGSGIKAYTASGNNYASTTLVLATANDAKLFEEQDWIQATGDSVHLSDTGAKIMVTGRNIQAGKLFFAGNVSSAIPSIADGYGLLRSGDLNSVVKGLGAWIPKTAPVVGGGDSFFGIDRAPYGEAAFGHRPTSTSSNLLNIGIDAAAYMYDVTGMSPDLWLVNSLDFAAIVKDITSLEQYIVPAEGLNGKKADIGYEAVRFHGPHGKIELVVDPLIPRGSSWMGVKDEAQWWTLGPMIDQIDLGMGNENGFVKVGVDGVGIRFGGFGQFVVLRPWDWAFVALPTA